AEPIDLHHPGHDMAAGGLPDESGREPTGVGVRLHHPPIESTAHVKVGEVILVVPPAFAPHT
ncbi:hypothetical protein IH992_27740, partial [Candidatus Poribacteria bacterium]|nr:hypothetical protein [Candidatus Poribacteria bacterium]